MISRGTLTLRGVLDLCVLALVAEAPLYGYELRDRLADRGISISNGTTYALLARMKSVGHITQHQPTAGSRRFYVSITDAGRAELRAGAEHWVDLHRAISAVLPTN